MAKGIRVNQLAKELGVQSKQILDKLRDEGLGDKAPNHMSVLPLGLAESVREWFSASHGQGTAVETAAPVAVAEKPKTTARRRKKAEAAGEEAGESPAPTAETEVRQEHEAARAATMRRRTPPAHAPSAPAAPAAEAPAEAAPAAQPQQAVAEARRAPEPPAAPVEARPAAAPVSPAIPTEPASPAAPPLSVTSESAGAAAAAAELPGPATTTAAPVAPAAAARAPAAPTTAAPPTTPPVTPAVSPVAEAPSSPRAGEGGGTATAPGAPAPGAPAPAVAAPTAPPAAKPAAGSRPTVTLASRAQQQQQAATERKPITPAPRLVVPKPAVIQGPRVVREEKPDIVPLPRPRRPLSPAAETPSTPQARPAAGRGVKLSEEDEEIERRKAAAKGRTNSNRRRGPDGRRGEAMEKLREFTDADLIERRDRLAAAASFRTGFDSHLRKSEARGTHTVAKTPVQRGGTVEIEQPITVRSLSAALGVKSSDIISKLMRQGIFATINQTLDQDVAEALALDYGVELKVATEPSLEEQLIQEFQSRKPDPGALRPRPPVVTILGHVDHGKTSLLDKIRRANVAASEAGGITQHTAAWMVEIEGADGKRKRVTFIDTPGHEAFTAMRARGANMTDVVVLVVSAAEGVQPQTIESINHARAAGVPIVVALNKIDRPDANPEMVLGQLAAQNLNPVEWGGDTEVVRTSAITGQGIKELIEILDYQAELLELKFDPTAPARGMVIEARIDPGLGPVATALVQDGTLKVGDVILCGPGYGRIRSLLDDNYRPIEQATASMPVIVSGLSELPAAGDKFFVVSDLERARAIAEERAERARQRQLAQQNRVSADNLLATIRGSEVKTINLIIKADVQGSVETLVNTVTSQNTDEVRVKVIHAAVGPITESDVQLAMASRINPDDPQHPNKVAIIGFHVVPDDAARALAEQNHIDVKLYRVIYEIFDDLKKSLSGMLEPEIREKLHGHAEIRQVFKVSKVGNIAGCMVTDGHIQRGSKIRLIRDGKVVIEDLSIETLRRMKDDVREVKAGFECGIKLAGYDDIKVGDRLEAYVREKHERTL